MERLDQWLLKRVAEGMLREVRAFRHGPELSYMFFADDRLIFSKACDDQLECIKEGLDSFCRCLSQRVNFLKSSLICSSNVSDQEASQLSSLVGIPLKKLGKYHGHHIAQGGNNRERYNELIQQVQSRVDGWKLSCLSRAGRLTLA